MQIADLTSPIHMINLPEQYGQQKIEIDKALSKVLNRGDCINGLEVKEFEHQLASYTQTPYVVACGNGTDALQLALMALEVGYGSEVIIPAFAYVSVAEVVVLLGAKPVFVDIENDYFFMFLPLLTETLLKVCMPFIFKKTFKKLDSIFIMQHA